MPSAFIKFLWQIIFPLDLKWKIDHNLRDGKKQQKITMYQTTEAQSKSETALKKKGFRFSAWLPFEPDAENQPAEGTEHLGVIVMVKRVTRFSTEYREINPDGFIN